MKVNASYQQNQNFTNFKSAYPVVHWVAEAGSSYAPVSDMKMVKFFQEKIITYLNSSLPTQKEIKHSAKKKQVLEVLDPAIQRLRGYIGLRDISYRIKPKVRSFYNISNKSVSNISYIISGVDVEKFNNEYAKEIGRQKKIANGEMTNKLRDALDKYIYKGLQFVNDYFRRIKYNEKTQVLHTKFEIVRNIEGKIQGYKFIDARFLPEFGPENPLEILKYQ